jgi:glutamyl-tRNA reductase
MPILVLGLSHRTAPVVLRERFAFADALLPETLARLRQSGLADEAVILSTCNRVELYVSTAADPRKVFPDLLEFLRACHDFRDPVTNELYQLDEPHSIEHLFKVACGLDSMVVGETEILGQLKKAYDLALQHRQTGPALNKAFQRAFHVAKQVRTETNIQRGATSVAAAAVQLAEKIFNALDDRRVMVIGAGETSEKAARALLSRGARSILVANRSYDRAMALAGELGGRAVRFENWAAEFRHVDVIISSTSAPHYILDCARLAPLMALRHNAPLLLIDIAVPRDIDPEVNLLDNVYLYNVDDLQAIADDSLKQRREEIARCEGIIREKAKGLQRPPPTAHAPGPPGASDPAPAPLADGRPAFGHD